MMEMLLLVEDRNVDMHTICEISYAARSKMIKHLENGIT